MLLSLRCDHKEHLSLLSNQPSEVLVDFCKLSIDYIQSGSNTKLYNAAAAKLQIEPETIQNCVYGLVNLLIEACKYQLNESDFRDSIISLGFHEDLQIILNKFYYSKKILIERYLHESCLKTWHFWNLQWRFEIQVSSRSLLHQSTPIITLNFEFEFEPDSNSFYTNHKQNQRKKNLILQTDLVNLVHLTQVLEDALNEIRSRHNRKIHKLLQ